HATEEGFEAVSEDGRRVTLSFGAVGKWLGTKAGHGGTVIAAACELGKGEARGLREAAAAGVLTLWGPTGKGGVAPARDGRPAMFATLVDPRTGRRTGWQVARGETLAPASTVTFEPGSAQVHDRALDAF